jgi:perosamine synthetase
MIPRGRLDYGWADLAAGLFYCLTPGSHRRAEARVERVSVGGEGFACLSVRSGLDLLLTELDLPPGSEVLVSAVTIRDMVRIVEEHGLVPVPVDMDMDRLELDLDSLRTVLSPRSKVLLVAHLFGSRMDLTPVAAVAREHGLLLVEDCAQSYMGDGYWGHPESDVTLTSFGPIKSASALGGAIVKVRDPDFRRRLRVRQAAYADQGRWWFLKRVARFALVRALMYPLPFSLFRRFCLLLGRSHDDLFSQSIRGFGDDRLFWKIRHRPGYPLLSLLARRVRRFGPRQIDRRVAVAVWADELMRSVRRPGRHADLHSHWVFPVLVSDPDALAQHLWDRGFDATRGRWSLYVTQEPEGRPRARAVEANEVMSHLLYLPVHPAVPRESIRRLAELVTEFAKAEDTEVADP